MNLSRFSVRNIPAGLTDLSKHREVILVAGAAVGSGALVHFLPERLTWGASKDNPEVTPSDEPTNPDVEINDPNCPNDDTVRKIEAQPCGVSADMSFGEAFAHAREELGAGMVFAWHGKLYNTFFREEWESLGQEGKQEFLNSVNWEVVPSDELDGVPADYLPTTEEGYAEEDGTTTEGETEEEIPVPDNIPATDEEIVIEEELEEVPVIGEPYADTGFEDVSIPQDDFVTVNLDLDGDLSTAEAVGIDLNLDGNLDVIELNNGLLMIDSDGSGGLDTLGQVVNNGFVVLDTFEDEVIPVDNPHAIPEDAIVEIPATDDTEGYLADNDDFSMDTDTTDFDLV